MKTFRVHTSFIPDSVVMGTSRITAPIVIIPKTDYIIVDTNQAFGIYIEVSAPSVEDSKKIVVQTVYVSPDEISKYGEVQNKLTLAEIKKILKNISFADSCIDFSWGWEVVEIEGEVWIPNDNESTQISSKEGLGRYEKTYGFLINTTFKRPDTNTGVMGIGRGRRMWIEETASETSVVMTAWVCIDLIIKHEVMEAFKFRNAKILNPHKTLSELAYPDTLK